MTTKNDKMAAWPISKLLFSMGIPAVFSMLIQALYSIVDSIYIISYSQEAMFAIGLAGPLQMVGLSVALGGSIGVASLVSRRMGEGRGKEANDIASTGVILTFMHTLLIVLLGVFGTVPFLSLFTNRPEIIALGNDYLLICMGLCFGQMYALFFERLLQAQGKMVLATVSQLIGAVINIVLDPILIFGYFGLTPLGIKGAAIATVAGQIVSAIFVATVVLFGDHEVRIGFKGLHHDVQRLKDIYAVALPTAVMNMVSSLTTTLMNNILVQFSEDAVTALSIYFKLQSFVFMPVFGFNQGALPILAYSYGAQNKQRYRETVKLFLMVSTGLMALGTILFVFFPGIPLSFFEMTDSLRDVCVVSLRYCALSFIPAASSIVIVTVFQSFGKGTMSMLESMMRQIGLLIPFAYLLSNIGLNEVFLAYPLAEILVVIIFLPFLLKTYKKSFQ